MLHNNSTNPIYINVNGNNSMIKSLLIAMSLVLALGFISSAYAIQPSIEGLEEIAQNKEYLSQPVQEQLNQQLNQTQKHLEIISFMIQEFRELEKCFSPICEVLFNGTHFIKMEMVNGNPVITDVSEELDAEESEQTEESKDSSDSEDSGSDSGSGDNKDSEDKDDDVIYEDECPEYSPFNFACADKDSNTKGKGGAITKWYTEIEKVYPNFHEIEGNFPDPFDHLEGDLAFEKAEADKKGYNYLPILLDKAVKEFDKYDDYNDGYQDIDRNGNPYNPEFQDRNDIKTTADTQEERYESPYDKNQVPESLEKEVNAEEQQEEQEEQEEFNETISSGDNEEQEDTEEQEDNEENNEESEDNNESEHVSGL